MFWAYSGCVTLFTYFVFRILDGINRYNYELLKCFLCVLCHVTDNAETNKMNAYNLAVCVAPSMLWAPTDSCIPVTEQSNSVTPVIQFIIENCVDIMGNDVRTILDNQSEIVTNHVASDSEVVLSSTQDSRTALSQFSRVTGTLKSQGRKELHLSDSNLTTLYSIIKSTTGKYCSLAFN